MNHLAFIDCETVSLIPGPATIWELALISRDEGEDREYLRHIRPDLTRADPRALAVGGYYERCKVAAFAPGEAARLLSPPDDTGEQTSPKRTTSAVIAMDVADRLAGAHLVAANPAFDSSHIAAFLRAGGECEAWDYHLTDIASLVRGRIAALGRSLPFPLKVADAARAVGINPDAYEAHSALPDARLVRDIFDAVMSGGAS